MRYRPDRIKNTGLSFTLIELLVVVAIIAILVGLIVPVHFAVRDHARAAKARATVKHLETGFREYFSHYRRWPQTGSDMIEIEGNLYRIMRGEDIGGKNPDRIAFLEFERPPATAPDHTTAYDPWRYDADGDEAWRAYRVQFDDDFNNQIDHDGLTIYRSVIVWSPGPDRTDYTDDDIRSWE